MHRVDAVILWLLFGGGTVLAAGSVLSSIKHSMSGAAAPSYPAGTTGTPDELLPEPESDCEVISEPVLLALPSPQNEPMEALELLPLPTDTSRTGKNKRKSRRAEPGKRGQTKDRGETRSPRRRKDRN